MTTTNGNPAGVGSPETPRPDADAILCQLTRILASPEFRSARSRARFLEYVVRQTLAGHEESLKEYTIGVEVFERGQEFDPKADGVVRTQAGLVRRHLEKYYAGEGRLDPVLVLIPKGHYVPEFRMQEEAVRAGEAPAARASRTHRRLRLWLSLGACAVAALLIAASLPRGRRASAASATTTSAADPVFQPLWGKFLQPGVSNVLAFGTPQFFTAGSLWLRDTDMNTPADNDAHGYVRLLRGVVGRDLIAAEAYTGIGEAHGVYLLSRFFLQKSRDLRVVRSRTLSWDNLKHDNVIFLTSARFRTLADQLAYPSDFVHVLGPVNRVQNRHPVGNEQAWYAAEGQGTDSGRESVDHAVITVWPGKAPGRRIMILSGGHTWGTQAAAEYVTEPAYLLQLNQQFLECQRKSGLATHSEYFQVLLRVGIRDQQPVSATYLAHHDLELDDLGSSPPDEPSSVASGSALKIPN